ncbi:hypothetical protein JCM13304A_22970 [Desulfothermus okinawensis JCM 13304]
MDKFPILVYIKALGLLLILLAVLIGILFAIKKFSPTTLSNVKQNQFKVLGNLNLGPKKSIIMVRFLNSVLLIGVTESNITLLKEVDIDHAQDFESVFKEKINNKSINSS